MEREMDANDRVCSEEHGRASSDDEIVSGERNGNGKRRLSEVTVSCQLCKQRKVKCDRNLPSCGWCSRHGAHCEYKERKKPGLRAGYGRELEQRLDKVESLLRSHSQLLALLSPALAAQLNAIATPPPPSSTNSHGSHSHLITREEARLLLPNPTPIASSIPALEYPATLPPFSTMQSSHGDHMHANIPLSLINPPQRRLPNPLSPPALQTSYQSQPKPLLIPDHVEQQKRNISYPGQPKQPPDRDRQEAQKNNSYTSYLSQPKQSPNRDREEAQKNNSYTSYLSQPKQPPNPDYAGQQKPNTSYQSQPNPLVIPGHAEEQKTNTSYPSQPKEPPNPEREEEAQKITLKPPRDAK